MSNKVYLIDMDGVLVRGEAIIPGADTFIQQLIDTDHKFMIVTNNSSHPPMDVYRRLRQHGLAVEPEHIYTSAMAAAQYLFENYPGGSVFALGNLGLFQALNDVGYQLSNEPDIVLLGESDHHPYESIIQACHHIRNGATFVITNPDTQTCAGRRLVPGTGAVAALITQATGKSPFIVGMPLPFMLQAALEQMQAKPEEALLIGDDLNTDIAMARSWDVESVLVLSGATSRDEATESMLKADTTVKSVGHIARKSLIQALNE